MSSLADELAAIVVAAVRRAVREELAARPTSEVESALDREVYTTVAIAARAVNLSETSIRRGLSSGFIPGLRCGRHWRVRISDVERAYAAAAASPGDATDVDQVALRILGGGRAR